VAIEDPCAIRRRALSVLAERGIAATVVCDAGYLAGVLDAARAGLGAALLATVGGQRPEGLTERADLPPVPAIRMSAHARRGADPVMVASAIDAIRTLLAEPAAPRAAA
jgi:hypothetical protein